MFAKIINTDPKEMVQFVDEEGKLTSQKGMPQIDKELLIKGYKTMVLSRTQDERLTQFQRQGRMLTFAPGFGEEATQLGPVMALETKDWHVPAFRSNAAHLWRGYTLKQMILYWNGNEEGNIAPVGVNMLPVNIPIGTQFSHAAGLAFASKIKKQGFVAMSVIGDGGTSEGEFYEAMNFAGEYDLPAIFIIQNNQWAISTPTIEQSKVDTLAQKAVAAGIHFVRADGNDLFATYAVAKEAVDRARSGKGPTLIELLTYRQGPHTTADNPDIYRLDKEKHQCEMKKDPIKRLQTYMLSKKIITDAQIEQIKQDSLEQVNKAFQEVTEHKIYSVEEIFKHTYATLNKDLEEQMNEAVEYFKNGGK